MSVARKNASSSRRQRPFRVGLVAGLLAFGLQTVGVPARAQDAAAGLEKAAEEAFGRDNLELAGALYRQAADIAAGPSEKARLLVTAGSVEHLAGRRDVALAALLEALRVEPDLRFRRDLYDETFSALFFEAQKRIVQEREQIAGDAMREGATHLRDHQWEKARDAFQRALAQKPDQPLALYNLALAQLHLREVDAAIAGFQKLLSLEAASPGSIPRDLRALALTNLGLLYSDQSAYPEAESSLEEAVRLDPSNQTAWSNLGVVRRRLNKTSAASEAFRRAYDLAPKDPWVINNLALSYTDAQEWMAAVSLLRQATQSHPNNSSLWLNFGVSQLGLGNETGALESFEATIRTDPDNQGGWAAAAALHLADYHLKLGEYSAVKRQAGRALTWNPALPTAWVYQGLAQKGLGDLQNARLSLERARDLEPTSAETQNSLGSVYFDLGLFDLAEKAFELALHLKPELRDAKNNLEAARQAKLRGTLGPRPAAGASPGASPAAGPSRPASPPPALAPPPELGLKFAKIDYASLGLSGLMIETVFPGTPAARAGLLAGDLLLRIDGKEIRSEAQLQEMLRALGGRTVNLDLLRANRPTLLRLVLP